MNNRTSLSEALPLTSFQADAFQADLADRITGKLLIIHGSSSFADLSALLTQAGHQVQQVETERQGLQAVISNPPDLILINVGLPDTAAYQFCRFLQTMDSIKCTPIIFLDSENESLHKVQTFRSGAADYIAQPFDPVDVLVRVETQLRVRQQRQKQVQLEAKICQLQEQLSDLITAVATLEALNQELEAKLQSSQTETKILQYPRATVPQVRLGLALA